LRSDSEDQTAWLADLTYVGGQFRRGLAVVSDGRTGRIVSVAREEEIGAARVVRLKDRALLPGLVNAHSHAFQRVIRGRTEYRTGERDTFWTWREMMYSAAARLTPEDIYDASRMAFLEMALAGVTSVGEFHYLHHNADGRPYDDPNLLSKQVVRAARDVGIRVALLRVAYARSGFDKPTDERQRRFITGDPADFLKHADALATELARPPAGERTDEGVAGGALPAAWLGVAPHSVRAVPLPYLREVSEYAAAHALPIHMHVAEQPAEIEACLAEHARTPVALLSDEGVTGPRFTAVHAVHVTDAEADALARSRSHVCACPTTERNLGDGVVPADLFFESGVRVALGTDSHAQIDLLEDARELELNLRLTKLSRAVLAPGGDRPSHDQQPPQLSSLAARLFECATVHGASSIAAPAGALEAGAAADFFAVDLNDPSLAGAGDDDLLPSVVFAAGRAAVGETVVGGRAVVESGRHGAQEEIVARFSALQRRLWGSV
jgi:formimidoylglutamate deiminase